MLGKFILSGNQKNNDFPALFTSHQMLKINVCFYVYLEAEVRVYTPTCTHMGVSVSICVMYTGALRGGDH